MSAQLIHSFAFKNTVALQSHATNEQNYIKQVINSSGGGWGSWSHPCLHNQAHTLSTLTRLYSLSPSSSLTHSTHHVSETNDINSFNLQNNLIRFILLFSIMNVTINAQD